MQEQVLFNHNHLQCISGKEHAIQTNKERYADRIEQVKWLIDLGLHTSIIAETLRVSEGTVFHHVSKHCTENTYGLKKRKMLGEMDHVYYYGTMKKDRHI